MKRYVNIDKQNNEDDEQKELRDLLDGVTHEFDLPSGGTELILLEIDPHRAHVCWTIEPSQARPFHPLVLRVYDISGGGDTTSAEQVFDVEVFGLQGRWYLDLWRDDRTFIAEIGYRNSDGSFKSLARSNEVKTPPADPEHVDRDTRHADPNGNPVHTDWPGDHVNAAETVSTGSADADTASVSPDNETKPDVGIVNEAINIEPVTILDPNFPLVDWSPKVPQDKADEPSSDETSHGKKQDVFSSEVDTVLAAGDAAVAFDEEVINGLTEEFPSAEKLQAAAGENREALQAFYQAASELPPAESAPAEMGGQSGDQVSAPAKPSSSPSPAPLEQIVGLSSLESAGRDVLLEVNAEIHIYGRAKPGTELTLYGQVVKTRPDGSFSVRRPLPHGAVILPLLHTEEH
ncbi:MAG TPA: DUF4912 domain-containing protein [Kiritimatiellia bacterium]|nr:DUF4912 domain-containing protein [Kiritimatiellia bacterium]